MARARVCSSAALGLIPVFALVPELRRHSLQHIGEDSELRVRFLKSNLALLQTLSTESPCIYLIEAGEDTPSTASQCKLITKTNCVVITIISSIELSANRVSCWQAGADLVLAGNCQSEEILWACRNLYKRLNPAHSAVGYKSVPKWKFERQTLRIVRADGASVRLSRNEGKVMVALNGATNQLVRRETLWRLLDRSDWQYSDRTLDVLVARIRTKLRSIEIDSAVILTHYGAGYELRINS
ncbi:winged helix-turn-helix domain-containing protein [Ferrimonas lipolytica]|uniref:Response regulator transcription factor n=1 Tax=Ferrimonas lipolytica TaxID=2724191 RepID=A0A6H1UD34_9GAMM|nr:winged helix-turn-helix domain-containing protein [Ferrimonas lipolytica]QIZ76500.1 response regulator transcription factor [Ferrimonas lipolytica]